MIWGGLGETLGKFLADTLENWAEHKKERVVVKRALNRMLTELELYLKDEMPPEIQKQIRSKMNRFKRGRATRQFIEEMQIIFEDE